MSVENVLFLADSPAIESALHESIVNIDLTGLPTDLKKIYNSSEEKIVVNFDILGNLDSIVIDGIYSLLDFIRKDPENKGEITLETLNRAIEHTGFKFTEEIKFYSEITKMNYNELCYFHVTNKESNLDWKIFFVDFLRFLLYKEAVGIPYRDDYSNITYNFPVEYRIEDYKSFKHLLNRVKVDIFDNSTLIKSIKSIDIYRTFSRVQELQSYSVFTGPAEDLKLYYSAMQADALIMLKNKKNLEKDSIEGAKYTITTLDAKAMDLKQPSNTFFVKIADNAPIFLEDEYTNIMLRTSDKENLLLNAADVVDFDTTVEKAKLNKELMESIKITGIIENENLVKPYVEWKTSNHIEDEINNPVLNTKRVTISILPYDRQRLQYEELKDKVDFRSLAKMFEDGTVKISVPSLPREDMYEYVTSKTSSELSRKYDYINLETGDGALVLQIRNMNKNLSKAVEAILERLKETNEQVDEECKSLSEKIDQTMNAELTEKQVAKIDSVLKSKFEAINLTLIDYNARTLTNDLMLLSLGKPEGTLVIDYLKDHLFRTSEIWGEVETASGLKIVPDIAGILNALVKQLTSEVLIDNLEVYREDFVEVFKGYQETNEINSTVDRINDIVRKICLETI